MQANDTLSGETRQDLIIIHVLAVMNDSLLTRPVFTAIGAISPFRQATQTLDFDRCGS